MINVTAIQNSQSRILPGLYTLAINRADRLCLMLVATLLTCGCYAQQTSKLLDTTQPNILILYADDLGYGDLTSYNRESKIPTPHLDRLAAQGMRFTDGHSSSGICTPSRYALLTGRHHWRKFHGIVDIFGESVFDAEELTLPEMLQAQGYATAAIGKWHLGWDWSSIVKEDRRQDFDPNNRRAAYEPDIFDWSKPIPDGPLVHGFDYYFGDTVINFPPYAWIQNDRVVDVPSIMMDTKLFKPVKEGRWEFRPGPMVEGWDPYENIPTTTEKAVAKIQEMSGEDKPFFMYFAFPSPHAPIIPNDEFDGSSEAGPYGDFVVETDAACGRLLQALEKAGVADNTIVIFTADNGPEHYAYQRDEKFDHWSSEPHRGLKRDIYEGGHRVPYIVKWPGLTEPGSVSDALVSQIDLMATLAAGLGIELPEKQAEDSFNLLPVLEDSKASVRSAHVHNTFKNKWALRSGQWLLIDAKDGYHSKCPPEFESKHGYTGDDLPVELYDLSQDLEQRDNLAADHPERVNQLRALLREIKEEGYPDPAFQIRRPNIVHIVADDLGVMDVGFMGDERYQTPNLDRLASQGMVFTKGYAPAANCAPSRACVMTGQNPTLHGVYTVNSSERGRASTCKIIPTPNTRYVAEEHVLLTEVFAGQGYETASIGKWHLGKDPTTQGVDINIAGTEGGGPGRAGYFSPYDNRNLPDGPEGEYLTDRLGSEAVQFIESNKDRPFFLYLPFFSVHTPIQGKPELVAKYTGRDDVHPEYAAMVESLDQNVGRVLEALDRLNLAKNTVVVFTSDNGGIRDFSPQDPYRAGKGSYYEGGVRVPLTIRWPGVIEPGTSSAVPVTGLDFYPTYLEILDLNADKPLDGESLIGLLNGTGKIEKRPLFWHFPIYLQAYDPATDDGRDPLFRTRPGSTMRYGKWKLHHYFEDMAYELYDLEADVGERNNLAEKMPKKLAELTVILDAWRERYDAPVPMQPNPRYNPAKDIWQP